MSLQSFFTSSYENINIFKIVTLAFSGLPLMKSSKLLEELQKGSSGKSIIIVIAINFQPVDYFLWQNKAFKHVSTTVHTHTCQFLFLKKLSAVFDTMDHTILLGWLKELGVGGIVLR